MDPTAAPLRPSVIDAAGTVGADVPCRRCAYNLRGLHSEGRCPECGTPVGRSLLGDLLKYSDPAWVKRVSNGLNLIVIGAIAGILFGCVMGGMTAGASQPTNPLLQLGVQFLAGLIGFIGAWMLTERDPSGIGEDKSVNARKVVRFALIVGLLATPLGFAQAQFVDQSSRFILAVLTGLAGLIALLGEWFKFVFYEQLARRIPDEIVAKRARVVRWGYVICMGAGILGGGIAVAAAPAGGMGPASPGFVGALIPLVAILGIGFLVFGIIAILMILRLRRLMIAEARAAALNWNVPQSAAGRMDPVSPA